MSEFTVTSAQYIANEITNDNQSAVEATIDGKVWSVPIDTNNVHYQAILDWVAEGNTIADAS